MMVAREQRTVVVELAVGEIAEQRHDAGNSAPLRLVLAGMKHLEGLVAAGFEDRCYPQEVDSLLQMPSDLALGDMLIAAVADMCHTLTEGGDMDLKPSLHSCSSFPCLRSALHQKIDSDKDLSRVVPCSVATCSQECASCRSSRGDLQAYGRNTERQRPILNVGRGAHRACSLSRRMSWQALAEVCQCSRRALGSAVREEWCLDVDAAIARREWRRG